MSDRTRDGGREGGGEAKGDAQRVEVHGPPHGSGPHAATPGTDPLPGGPGVPASDASAMTAPVHRGDAPPPVHSERRRRSVGWQSRDVVRAAALVIALWLALRLLWFAHPLVLAVFLGVLFGLAIAAGVDRLQSFGLRIPRGITAAGIVVVFFAGLTLLGMWMAPTLRDQSRELRQRIPESIDKFDQWAEAHRNGLLGALFELGGTASPTTDSTAQEGAGSGPRPLAPRPDEPVAQESRERAAAEAGADTTTRGQDTGTARGAAAGGAQADSTVGAGSQLRQRLMSQLSGIRRYLFPFLSSTVAALGGLILIVFLSIYIGADPQTYHDGLMKLFPRRSRDRAGEVLSAMALGLRKWLVTQLMAMVAIGIVTTVVLLALRVKAAVALGVLAGLLEFIPTVGPILSAIPAIAMGFVDSPEKALAVVIAYVLIQFFENHILIPLLMKQGVDVPPALTIITQALMALVFGFIGLLVAVPALVATMVAVKMLYVEDVVGEQVDVFDSDDDD